MSDQEPLLPDPSAEEPIAANAVSQALPVPAAPSPPPRWPSVRWMLVIVLVVLATKYLIEPLAESFQHAITRGHERAKAEVARTQLAKLSDTAAAFRLVAQSVGPSVVHIDTFRAEEVDEAQTDDQSVFPYRKRPHPLLSTGQGSGVIVDADGFVLTNYHVIEHADPIHVKLSDGRTIRSCQVVGIDKLTDLAVLKIDAADLVAAPWGDSDALEVGDWVLAVGNPFGLDRSVTAGIVSAKQRRQVVDSLPYQDFLQTDAAVNPGNSGGPLVNLQGEVVGINAAIVGENYRGISFAIPSSIAQDVYLRLKATGKVVRGWLGVEMQEVVYDADETGTTEPRQGVLISRVLKGSPAEQAGLKAGDIIVRWNKQPVADRAELGLLVSRTGIDSQAQALVLRDGEEVSLQVSVGERPTLLPRR